jgi:hypothetical protein
VLLRLSKLLAQFADHMKVQCGVSRQLAAQGGDRNLKCGDGSKCSRRIGVSRALGKPEYVLREQERHDVLAAVRRDRYAFCDSLFKEQGIILILSQKQGE